MNRETTAAKVSAMAILFCNGLLYSTWGVSVPLIMRKFSLSEGALSLALAAVAVGGIVTMARAGQWIARSGSGRASALTGMLMAITAAPILAIPEFYPLLFVLFVYGVATAANDVAANAQGAHLESVAKKSLIGALHASFSVGGLFGSLIAGNWTRTGLPPEANFYVLTGFVGVVMLVAARFLRNEETSISGTSVGNRVCSTSTMPAKGDKNAQHRLRAFGILAFAALVVEGAIYDWAAVYMGEVIHAPSTWTGYGYASFAVGMTMGRISGDFIRDRFHHQRVIAGSGIVSVGGLVVILASLSPLQVVVGFFITGIGVSNIIPVLFSSAGKLSLNAGMTPSVGLAITTRIAYVGLLAGPLIIGPLAELFGLRVSLVTLAVAIMATCGGWLWLSHRTGGMPWKLQMNQIRNPLASHSPSPNDTHY